MPKELRVKAVSDVADAISGLRDVEGSLRGVGTAALEAAGKGKAEWAAFDAELAKTNPELEGISSAAFKAQGALDQMGKATTAGSLESSLVKSYQAVEQLENKMNAAKAAGVALGEGPAASLAVMKAAIDSGKAKLDELRASTERAKEALGLTGESGQKAAVGIAAAGTAADKAGTSFNTFRGSLAQAGVENTALLSAADKLDQKLKQLEASSDSPRALVRSSTAARLALNDLEKAAKTAGVALEGELGARVQSADKAIVSGAESGLKFQKASKAMTEQAREAGLGLAAMGGAASSSGGMLDLLKMQAITGGIEIKKLSDVTGKMDFTSIPAGASSFAKLAGAALAVGAAFKVGYEIGLKLDEQLKSHGINIEKAYGPLAKLIVGESQENQLLTEKTLAMKGVIDARNADRKAITDAAADLEKTIPGFKTTKDRTAELNVEINAAAKYFTELTNRGKDWKAEVEANKGPLEAFAKKLEESKVSAENLPPALAAVIAYLKQIGGAAAPATSALDGFKSALDGIGKVPVGDAIKGVAEGLGKVKAAGGDVAPVLEDAQEKLQSLYDQARKDGPEALDKLRESLGDQVPAWQWAEMANASYREEMVKGLREMEKGSQASEKSVDEKKKEADAAKAAATAYSALHDPLSTLTGDAFGAAAAAGRFGDDLDRVAEATVAAGGELKQEKPIYLTVAAATDEATAALQRYIDKLGEFAAKQSEVLGVMKGWKDYLVGLKSGFDEGVTSLGDYINELVRFRTELQQTYAGATGEAKKSLQEMTDLINEFVRGAMMGGPTASAMTGGMAGYLDRAVNRKT